MKRFFTYCALFLTAFAVNAQNLSVKGVAVTDGNMSDILGDGKVKFDKSTNTLTFTDADITYDQCVISVISTWKENLNIKFEGKNTFTTTGKNSCIALSCKQQEVKFYADEDTKGSLTINVTDENTGNQGIDNTGHNNITISCLDLTIDVPRTDGIGPLNSGATVEKLTIDKSNVAIKAGRAALRFKEVELIDAHYLEGYAINGEKTAGCTYNGTVMKEVRVGEDIYGIWVAGEEVTPKNRHNILHDEAEPYTMYYEPKTNELTLNNVNLNVDAESAIWIKNDGASTDNTFKIKLIGKNIITSSVSSEKTLLFEPVNVDSVLIYSEDGGSLEVTSPSDYATLANSKKLAVKDCSVTIKNTNAAASAFRGQYYSFVNANFAAETAGQDVLKDVQSIYYYGCFMTTPEDGFLAGNHTLASKGNTNQFVVVPGVDNIKPNFYYGDTPSVVSQTHNSARIKFGSAMDNLSYQNKMSYSIQVAKAEDPEAWVMEYDLDIHSSGSEHQIEITDLEASTSYVARLKATDEAGNYNYYNVVEFTTLEDTTGLDSVITGNSYDKVYNAVGMKAGNNYRGVIIKNGKKYNRK